MYVYMYTHTHTHISTQRYTHTHTKIQAISKICSPLIIKTQEMLSHLLPCCPENNTSPDSKTNGANRIE